MKSKRFREVIKLVDPHKLYKLEEAIDLLKKVPPVKFDQSVDLALKMGVEAQKSDQQVRGIVSLPHGIGRKLRVVVFARGDKEKEALDAGADFVGSDDLIEKIQSGWFDFDAVIAVPDMMREVGKLGKVLGPRGLMVTSKSGGVTNDVGGAVREVKAGRREFKNDKHGVVSGVVGKLSFPVSHLMENIKVFLNAVSRAKPSSSKGQYFRSCFISSTMGPGLKFFDLTEVMGV